MDLVIYLDKLIIIFLSITILITNIFIFFYFYLFFYLDKLNFICKKLNRTLMAKTDRKANRFVTDDPIKGGGKNGLLDHRLSFLTGSIGFAGLNSTYLI